MRRPLPSRVIGGMGETKTRPLVGRYADTARAEAASTWHKHGFRRSVAGSVSGTVDVRARGKQSTPMAARSDLFLPSGASARAPTDVLTCRLRVGGHANVGSRDVSVEAGSYEIVKHAVERTNADGQMALALLQSYCRTGDVRSKPLSVSERHIRVLAALPHEGRHGDLGQAEAPRLDKGEVVIDKAVRPKTERLCLVGNHVLAKLSCQYSAINVRQ